MRPVHIPRLPIPSLCLCGLLSLASPGCGEDPKAASASTQKTLEEREKSLRERQTKQAPAKHRR